MQLCRYKCRVFGILYESYTNINLSHCININVNVVFEIIRPMCAIWSLFDEFNVIVNKCFVQEMQNSITIFIKLSKIAKI